MLERIKKISEYFKGIEMMEGLLIIKVQYKNRWGAYPSKDKKINVAKSEEVADEWFYYGDSEKVDISDVFDLIDETIEMNLNVGAKIELLNVKVEELKKLFSDTPLAKLQTLRFVMDEIKPKKRKYTKKVKEANNDNNSNIIKEEND